MSIATDVIIATAADAERAFSRGGLNVSKLRHALSDESVRAATVVASWEKSGIQELLPEGQLIAHVQEKPKRSGKGKGKAKALAVVPDVTAMDPAEIESSADEAGA